MSNEILNQWEDAATTYSEAQEQSEFVTVNKTVIKKRFPKLNGEKVLDIGCGYGWYTDYFYSIGGNVLGCDGAKKMVEIAKQKYPDCCFEVVNIEAPLPYGENNFDIVFCNQVLMDIEHLDGLLSEIYRITKPNGIFYASIVHPTFYDCAWGKNDTGFRETKIMSKYLSEYSFENEFWGKTKHFHRTISRYINSAIKAGFTLENIDEPISYDGIEKSKEFPLFLFTEYIKRR